MYRCIWIGISLMQALPWKRRRNMDTMIFSRDDDMERRRLEFMAGMSMQDEEVVYLLELQAVYGVMHRQEVKRLLTMRRLYHAGYPDYHIIRERL